MCNFDGHDDEDKKILEVYYIVTKPYYEGLIYPSSLVSQIYDNTKTVRDAQNIII